MRKNALIVLVIMFVAVGLNFVYGACAKSGRDKDGKVICLDDRSKTSNNGGSSSDGKTNVEIQAERNSPLHSRSSVVSVFLSGLRGLVGSMARDQSFERQSFRRLITPDVMRREGFLNYLLFRPSRDASQLIPINREGGRPSVSGARTKDAPEKCFGLPDGTQVCN